MHPLEPLFAPRSVAIVGASQDANKVGGRPLAFLRRAGYAGRIVPVNPTAAAVQGLPAVPSLAALAERGEGLDQVIVAVPNAQAVLDEAAAAGARSAIVFASTAEALRVPGGLRVLGPNSLGLFNTAAGHFGTFATALDGAWPRAGGVGVATQSGAFGSYFFGLAQQRGLGFSHFVATGNEADVDVADCVDFLAQDPATRLVVIALEGCRDGRKLVRAIRAARAAGKPVLAMKVGVSDAGAAAAATHTGSLAGADRVFDAALREAGAVRLASLEALVDAACVAGSGQGAGALPASRDLLIVTTSGGIGVLAADAAEASGLALPPVGAEAQAAIRAIAPLADGANPVDTSAGILGDLAAYARIAAVALEARPYGAVLLFMAHVARNPAHWAQLRDPLVALRRRHASLPFAAVLMADAAIRADLESEGFVVAEDPTRAVQALSALAPAASPERGGTTPSTDDARLPADADLATEAGARAALAARGIPFAPDRFVRDADEAAAAGRALGYPVVLKIVSPQIAHKTEAGGVALGIADEAALRAAVPAMRDRVAARRPDAAIDGFIVARQLAGGVELIVGTHRDPVFGPVISVGPGGVLAELIDDVALALAPVDEARARELLLATRAAPLLRGFRGAAAADIDALAGLVSRLSRLAAANADRIAGLELNPVLARPDAAFALDALIHLDAGRVAPATA